MVRLNVVLFTLGSYYTPVTTSREGIFVRICCNVMSHCNGCPIALVALETSPQTCCGLPDSHIRTSGGEEVNFFCASDG